MHLTFDTPRLFLKPTTEEDAPLLLDPYNTPKWLQFIGDRNVKTIAQAEEWISSKITPQFERRGFGNYIVIRKSDQVKMGACGLYDREGVEGIDLGFAFLPEYEGQGYGFEAATKMREAAFDTFSLQQLSAITVPDNHSSIKLLEKLRFAFQKMIRLPNDEVELMLYEYESRENR